MKETERDPSELSEEELDDVNGEELPNGQPLSFSASSVWGASTRFCLQIGMIP